MTLRKRRVLEIERGSTRSHFMENSLWKEVWTLVKGPIHSKLNCAV